MGFLEGGQAMQQIGKQLGRPGQNTGIIGNGGWPGPMNQSPKLAGGMQVCPRCGGSGKVPPGSMGGGSGTTGMMGGGA